MNRFCKFVSSLSVGLGCALPGGGLVLADQRNLVVITNRIAIDRKQLLAAALMALAVSVPQICQAQIMAVGIDRKFAYDDKAVRQALEPGHDEVMFFDVKNPANPKLVGSVQIENSIIGPPTNVAVSPDQSFALVANAVHSEKTEAGWKAIPADEVFVVDLKSSPLRVAQTLKVGRQPSGIAISKDSKFALVANRDSKSVTMLLIDGATISVGETISTEDSV